MNRNNHEEEVVMTASGGNAFSDHTTHCDHCRGNVMSDECQEGNRALRQTVRDGTANRSDRDLDELRNGRYDELED